MRDFDRHSKRALRVMLFAIFVKLTVYGVLVWLLALYVIKTFFT